MVFAGALVVAALGACSNGKFKSNPAFDAALEYVGLGKEAPPTPEAKPSVGPPLFVGYNAIRVGIPGVGLRGQSRYYVAPDGVEIAMNNGFLTRVIGLGIDLDGMFLPADGPHLNDFVGAAREGTVTQRVAEYFRKGRIIRDSYRCDLSFDSGDVSKGVINERCSRFFGDSGYTNRYWVEENRVICSLQWFHPDGGMLQFFDTPQQAQSLDLRKQGC
jgi:hypothetical protein